VEGLGKANGSTAPRARSTARKWQRTAQGKRRDLQMHRIKVMLRCTLDGYRAGDLSLEALLRLARRILATHPAGFPFDQDHRDRRLGALMWKAAAIKPAKRGPGPKGVPGPIRRMVRELAEDVSKHEGVARTSERARSRVLSILASVGYRLTDAQVRECLRAAPRLPRRR
jgi:hypothetical protein